MSRYRIIRTVDLIDDEEFLVVPEPDYNEYPIDDNTPYWFDSPDSWDINDFTNSDIYKSVELIMVEF